ncbi:YceI family protein [Caulobacter sp. RL271]|jgi:polyisoprenoid-binding protein YceI|uniref:YceI family protein n=1 Tax=Caulobacter segnis TaxID=88688 RepID=A0ABY4ZQ25_9CAUL|nr:YceI family protein [Caulobacter segnis]USQ94693.1 YceI family protein [Caulobacter segnis]
MRSILPVVALLALAACSPQPPDKKAEAPAAAAPTTTAPKPPKADIPAGDYTLDKSHATLVFRVSHLGFSNYTAAFADFDAKLRFDQNNAGASALEATINPMSLTLPAPPEGFLAELTGPQWLNTASYPSITFKSTKIETTGPNTGKVTGDLTLHGVTRPVTLDVTYNGGYVGHPMDPHARIGFSAKGTFKRSDFGIAYGVPAPGSTMGVSDEVQVAIEAEFSGPPLATAPAAPAAKP